MPSGQVVTLQEVVMDTAGPEGLTARFLFVAPQIARDGGSVSFETAAADMAHLCASYALPRTEGSVAAPSQIVISLADRPVPFGTSDPEATQFFEAYRIENGTCIWEMF